MNETDYCKYLLDLASESVKFIDKDAVLQCNRVISRYRVDFYFCNITKQRIYLCQCYESGGTVYLDEVKIFKEV